MNNTTAPNTPHPNAPGPNAPEPHPAGQQSSVPDAFAGLTAEQRLAAAIQATPAPGASGSTDAANDQAGPDAAGGPETKEKNKIFDAVRNKVRASMLEQEVERLKAEIVALKAAPAEYQDRNLRLMAEMENLRRRTERERADTAKFAITKFARDVLTVADTFQRAIDTVPKDEAAVEGTLKNFLDGVALTERELLNVLERNGVKRVDPMGARFDPNHHQAMMELDNPDVPAGTVVRVFQPAYLIEDRILRPAMVVVSRGGPKLAKVPSEATLAGEIFPEPASDTTAEDQPAPGSADPKQG